MPVRTTTKGIPLQSLCGNHMQVFTVTFFWTPYPVLRYQMAVHCVWVKFTCPVVEYIYWECKVWPVWGLVGESLMLSAKSATN